MKAGRPRQESSFRRPVSERIRQRALAQCQASVPESGAETPTPESSRSVLLARGAGLSDPFWDSWSSQGTFQDTDMADMARDSNETSGSSGNFGPFDTEVLPTLVPPSPLWSNFSLTDDAFQADADARVMDYSASIPQTFDQPAASTAEMGRRCHWFSAVPTLSLSDDDPNAVRSTNCHPQESLALEFECFSRVTNRCLELERSLAIVRTAKFVRSEAEQLAESGRLPSIQTALMSATDVVCTMIADRSFAPTGTESQNTHVGVTGPDSADAHRGTVKRRDWTSLCPSQEKRSMLLHSNSACIQVAGSV